MAEKKEAKKTKRPTALKRDIQNVKRRQQNRIFKSQVRTAIRALRDGIEKNAAASLPALLNTAYSLMDKGVKKGVFKKNKASRTKSRLSANIAAMQQV
jgi:small subunit ribosomal protein S20